MYARKIAYLIAICLCLVCCFCCSNKNDKTTFTENQNTQLNSLNISETDTDVAITTNINTSITSTQSNFLQTAEIKNTSLASSTTQYTTAAYENAEQSDTSQTVDNSPDLEFNQTQDVENIIEQENTYIPDDCIIIHDTIIPITHAPANQSMVDEYDVVQDEGFYTQAFNKILLFGHVNKSFNILNSICVNEVITLVNSGESKNYLVNRSELGTVNDANTDIVLSGEERTVLYTDMGYPELVLITCADENVNRYRWVVIATEME